MRTILCLILGVLGGCASLPNAVVEYRLPKAVSTVTVVESYACYPDQQDFVVVSTPSINTRYSADTAEEAKHEIYLKSLQGFLASNSVGFSFSPDGRILGVNATATGNGGEIVGAAVALATGIRAGNQAAGVLEGELRQIRLPLCAVIEAFGDPKTGALTITRSATYDHKVGKAPSAFEPDATTQFLFNAIEVLKARENSELASIESPSQLFNQLSIPVEEISRGSPQEPTVRYLEDANDYMTPLEERRKRMLVVRKLRNDSLVVYSRRYRADPKMAVKIASHVATVPDHSPQSEYLIPLPVGMPFGESSIGLVLTEAGAVTSVAYGSKNGTAAAMQAASQLNGYFNPSASQIAAEFKARADVIAQQARFAGCQANPDNCKP